MTACVCTAYGAAIPAVPGTDGVTAGVCIAYGAAITAVPGTAGVTAGVCTAYGTAVTALPDTAGVSAGVCTAHGAATLLGGYRSFPLPVLQVTEPILPTSGKLHYFIPSTINVNFLSNGVLRSS